MARNSICNACEMGDHKGHRRVIQPAPAGGVGGVVCTCDGECKDGRYKRTLGQLLGLSEAQAEKLAKRMRAVKSA